MYKNLHAYAHQEVLRQLSHGFEPYLQDFLSKESPKCSSNICLRHSSWKKMTFSVSNKFLRQEKEKKNVTDKP